MPLDEREYMQQPQEPRMPPPAPTDWWERQNTPKRRTPAANHAAGWGLALVVSGIITVGLRAAYNGAYPWYAGAAVAVVLGLIYAIIRAWRSR